MSDEPAVAISGLRFSYDARPILRDVDLIVHAGRTACIVGPNGGGKTTLLKLILGLLKPDRGSIRLFGDTPERGRRRSGYAPQYGVFDPTFPATVSDVVMMGRIGCGRRGRRRRSEDRRAVAESLQEVGLSPLADTPFSALSGGQRQRVLIARALASKPDLLLLDEPTAGMDAAAEEDFHALLERLAHRLTMVMVSHDIGFVSDLADSVVCVKGTVNVHPTDELTGEVMREMYGRDVRLIRHDHTCARYGGRETGGGGR